MIRFDIVGIIVAILLAIIGWQYWSGKNKDEKISELAGKNVIWEAQWEAMVHKSEAMKSNYESTLLEVNTQNATYKKRIIKLQNEKIPVLCPDKFIWMKEKKEEFKWPD